MVSLMTKFNHAGQGSLKAKTAQRAFLAFNF